VLHSWVFLTLLSPCCISCRNNCPVVPCLSPSAAAPPLPRLPPNGGRSSSPRAPLSRRRPLSPSSEAASQRWTAPCACCSFPGGPAAAWRSEAGPRSPDLAPAAQAATSFLYPPSQCEAKQRLGAFRALTCGATGRRPLRFLLLRLPCRRRPSVCPTPPSEPAWEQQRGGATTARLRRRRGSQPSARGCSRRCADRWNAAPFAALFSSLSFLHTGHLQMQLGFAAGDGLT
jgi:hypothetical protein